MQTLTATLTLFSETGILHVITSLSADPALAARPKTRHPATLVVTGNYVLFTLAMTIIVITSDDSENAVFITAASQGHRRNYNTKNSRYGAKLCYRHCTSSSGSSGRCERSSRPGLGMMA